MLGLICQVVKINVELVADEVSDSCEYFPKEDQAAS